MPLFNRLKPLASRKSRRSSRRRKRSKTQISPKSIRSAFIETLEERVMLADWSGAIIVDTVWTNDEVQVLTGDVTVAAGVTLTINPGTVVKALTTATDLKVNGTLLADGTAAAPIIFTSLKDDSAGGDTNNDGTVTTPAKGNWGHILFSVNSTGSIMDIPRSVMLGASETPLGPQDR
ncbi:MAG: hypothetical protein COA78_32950 [Blastopirellula sp.]|nr:MAG: hypothetical protein COA78_32950 [Blastopirellula sp.]